MSRGIALSKQWAAILLVTLVASCATYTPKYADPDAAFDVRTDQEADHVFYLIGDAGLSPHGGLNPVLRRFRDRLDSAPPNSTAIFLGDNIYPAGMPSPKDSSKAYQVAAGHLEAQLRTLENFAGRPLFIPGNHDWYSGGLRGLKRQENFVEDYLDRKDAFLPKDGCPIVVEEVTDEIVMLLIDTEWYLANWDRHRNINDDCDIKDRDIFWEVLRSEIRKYADKTLLIAAHHPLTSYGTHGGQYSMHEQFYPYSGPVPLPVIGTLANLFRKTSGVSAEDMQNKRYLELQKRLLTLAQYGERVIIASGHEHTLQYNLRGGIPQIVSGAGSKEGYTRLIGNSLFSTGMGGYAILEVYPDGSSRVRYYGVDAEGNENFLFTTEVYGAPFKPDTDAFAQQFPGYKTASVYTPGETEKSGFYEKMWGERYREDFATAVRARVALLDTLYGGLEPVRKGGGQQSKSLRLRRADGSEYVMRALRKQAEQNLQAMAFTDQFVIGELQDTAPERFLEDLYTGAHPYAPFALETLQDALGILHANPRLFFIPKQPALGKYNTDFGDELYMVEEHVSKGHGESVTFGNALEIASTYEMFEALRKDERYSIDTDAYIRARLFDMLIGDWDRHQDQWRWARLDLPGSDKNVFQPIPRDRDQAFSIMGDGLMGGILTRMVPAVRKMEGFHEAIRDPRMFNTNPFSLDLALLGATTQEQWVAQARYIREQVTPGVVDASFNGFPEEVRGPTTLRIRETLLVRRDNLEEAALEYYRALQRYVVISGTDKDDWFVVRGVPGGAVHVEAYRKLGGEKRKKYFDRTLDPDLCKEIWIYGLDDGDRFELDLPKGNRIRVRIVGGLGKDQYVTTAGHKSVIYDHKDAKSDFQGPGNTRKALTNRYLVNTYRPLDLADTRSQLVPSAGFNPDDGFRLGLAYSLTEFGFRRNPFTYRHGAQASFYFATSGFNLEYQGEFANLFGNWNLQLGARYTTPNFSRNFFGFGNETGNPEDELGLDYNRVRTRILEFTPALVWRGPMGGSLRLHAAYEDIRVEETEGRFINEFYEQDGVESTRRFLGAGGRYYYENLDNTAFPTLGMSASLEAGYKEVLSISGERYGYIVPALGLVHRLVPSGQLVLATRWKAHFNLGNGYEFYQAAAIGASDGPRSYRNERFSGKTAYYQVTDLRYQFGRFRTGIVPVSMGLFGGFDYGRVWQPEDPSRRWHTSYGGGVFINGIDVITLNTALFYGEDGTRFSFGLGFTF